MLRRLDERRYEQLRTTHTRSKQTRERGGTRQSTPGAHQPYDPACRNLEASEANAQPTDTPSPRTTTASPSTRPHGSTSPLPHSLHPSHPLSPNKYTNTPQRCPRRRIRRCSRFLRPLLLCRSPQSPRRHHEKDSHPGQVLHPRDTARGQPFLSSLLAYTGQGKRGMYNMGTIGIADRKLDRFCLCYHGVWKSW
jgi:hypothetical protein